METDSIALNDIDEDMLQILLENLKIKKEYRAQFKKFSITGSILSNCASVDDIVNRANIPVSVGNVLLPIILQWKQKGVKFGKTPTKSTAFETIQNPISDGTSAITDIENPKKANGFEEKSIIKDKIPLIEVTSPMLLALVDNLDLPSIKISLEKNSVTGAVLHYCESPEDIKEVTAAPLPVAKAFYIHVLNWKNDGVPRSATIQKSKTPPLMKPISIDTVKVPNGPVVTGNGILCRIFGVIILFITAICLVCASPKVCPNGYYDQECETVDYQTMDCTSNDGESCANKVTAKPYAIAAIVFFVLFGIFFVYVTYLCYFLKQQERNQKQVESNVKEPTVKTAAENYWKP